MPNELIVNSIRLTILLLTIEITNCYADNPSGWILQAGYNIGYERLAVTDYLDNPNPYLRSGFMPGRLGLELRTDRTNHMLSFLYQKSSMKSIVALSGLEHDKIKYDLIEVCYEYYHRLYTSRSGSINVYTGAGLYAHWFTRKREFSYIYSGLSDPGPFKTFEYVAPTMAINFALSYKFSEKHKITASTGIPVLSLIGRPDTYNPRFNMHIVNWKVAGISNISGYQSSLVYKYCFSHRLQFRFGYNVNIFNYKGTNFFKYMHQTFEFSTFYTFLRR